MFVNNKGFSLAEILFCIAIMGLLVLSVASLERSVSLTQKMMTQQDDVPAQLRLLQTLREEIHSAESMEVVAPGKLVLTVHGKRVEWRSEGNLVRRIAETQARWQVQNGVVFREMHPARTVEILLPKSQLYSYCSIGGGLR